MPGRGPAPKPAEQRRRRNADPVGTVSLPADDVVRGEPLDVVTGVESWLPQTLSWWETWRRSPQAAVFLETDWQALARTAAIVERFWERPSGALAAEIRLVEASLGATVVDRQRARMKVEESEPDGPALAPVVDARAAIAARLRPEK